MLIILIFMHNITRRKQARISIQVDDEPDVKTDQQCIKNIGLDLIKNDKIKMIILV